MTKIRSVVALPLIIPTALQFSIAILFHGSFLILSVPQILPIPEIPVKSVAYLLSIPRIIKLCCCPGLLQFMVLLSSCLSPVISTCHVAHSCQYFKHILLPRSCPINGVAHFLLILNCNISTSAPNPYCCPINSVGQVLPIHGALSAFWCQGGQRANCSPGEPTMVTFLSNDSLHCALCTTLH